MKMTHQEALNLRAHLIMLNKCNPKLAELHAKDYGMTFAQVLNLVKPRSPVLLENGKVVPDHLDPEHPSYRGHHADKTHTRFSSDGYYFDVVFEWFKS